MAKKEKNIIIIIGIILGVILISQTSLFGLVGSKLYMYTEDASSSSISNNVLYVNYNKLIDATAAVWQVKHGSDEAYNITLPDNCFNSNPNEIKLRFISNIGESYGQCYALGTWYTITPVKSGTFSGFGFGDSNAESRMTDGNWDTGANFNMIYKWISSDSIGTIYEESIWWVSEGPFCTDSDGGLDYYTAGTVVARGTTLYDYCYNETHILEGYCLDRPILAWGDVYNFHSGALYECPGGCADSICLGEVEEEEEEEPQEITPQELIYYEIEVVTTEIPITERVITMEKESTSITENPLVFLIVAYLMYMLFTRKKNEEK